MHTDLESLEGQRELAVKLFTPPLRFRNPQGGELGAALIGREPGATAWILPDERSQEGVEQGPGVVAEHGLDGDVVAHEVGNAVGPIAHVGHRSLHVLETDQETVGRDGVDQIHHVRPGCAAGDQLLNRVERKARYRSLAARSELSHYRDRQDQLLRIHVLVEFDPPLEPQTLLGSWIASEMSARPHDLTTGAVVFLVGCGSNESEAAGPTAGLTDPLMWPKAGFELVSRQLALLDLSRGRYEAAFERLLPITRHDRLDLSVLILGDFIEASARSGRPAEAAAAFERLAVRGAAGAAPLGLGTVARCRAFLSDED